MTSFDLWLAGFGLRATALVAVEFGTFLFVLPTLFNLHNDLADAGAAFLALTALIGGLLWGGQLTREFGRLISDNPKKDRDHE
ncbi:MAG: hypothetical protein ABIS14_01130 [Sphingomonas sp.]